MTNLSHARVRFAPSPTGHMHLGSARTALYDYLIAKKTKGQFILRIEDTDQNRLVTGAEEELMEGLRWLGMDWDEGPDIGGKFGPYRQSERKQIYLQYANQLVENNHAYYCFCSPERLAQVRKERQDQKEMTHYDGHCRNLPPDEASRRVAQGEKHVIRFRIPQGGTTVINDLLRGEIVVENRNLDDFILIKSDGWAVYHLAAVVDDHLMNISHVIRGEEWIPTLPLHSLIHRAFGWEEPVWVHLSVFLKPSGKGKMSKREADELDKDGYSIFIKDLKLLGYLPEAVVNWIVLMGWSYDDHTELFSMDDLIEKFSFERLNPSPAAINFSKLDYFNRQYVKRLNDSTLAEYIQPYFIKAGYQADLGTLKKVAPLINERITTLDDAVEFAKFFFIDKLKYDRQLLIIEGLSPSETVKVGEGVVDVLSTLSQINPLTAEIPLSELMIKFNITRKQLLSFLREAISAQRVTPPLFECMEILGKDKVITRIQDALNVLV